MVNRKSFAPGNIRRACHRLGWMTVPIAGRVEVYSDDGRAVILPSTGGTVFIDWFVFCRYLRRHGKRWEFK